MAITAAGALLASGCSAAHGSPASTGPWPTPWLEQTLGALTSLWEPAGPFGGYFLQPEGPGSPALAADSVLTLDEAGYPVRSVLPELRWSFDSRTGLFHDPQLASYDDETTYAVLEAAAVSGEKLPPSLVTAVSAGMQAHETALGGFHFIAPHLAPEPAQTAALFAARIAKLLLGARETVPPRWVVDLGSSFRCTFDASPAGDPLSAAATELQTASLLGRRCGLSTSQADLLGTLGEQALRKLARHPDPPSIGAIGLDLAPIAGAVPSLAGRWRAGLARIETAAEAVLRTMSLDGDFALPIVQLLRAEGQRPQLGSAEVSWLRTTWRWQASFADPGTAMQDPYSTILGEQAFLVAARLAGRTAVLGVVDDAGLLAEGAQPAWVLVLDAGTGTRAIDAVVSRLSAAALIRYAPAVAAFVGMVVTGRLSCAEARPVLLALAGEEVAAASREGGGAIPVLYGYSGGLTAEAVRECAQRSRPAVVLAERLRRLVAAGLRAWARAGAARALATSPLAAWLDAEAECTLGVRPTWSRARLAGLRAGAALTGGGARGASGWFSLEATYALLRVGQISASGCAGGWWAGA